MACSTVLTEARTPAALIRTSADSFIGRMLAIPVQTIVRAEKRSSWYGCISSGIACDRSLECSIAVSRLHLLDVQRKISRHNNHEQQHGAHRADEKFERRLGNNGFAGFTCFPHDFETVA